MTSNLSRGISDLHIFFFSKHFPIPALTYTGSIIPGDLIWPYKVDYTNLKKPGSSSFSTWKLKKRDLAHCCILQEAESIMEQVDDTEARKSKADSLVSLSATPTFLLQRSVVKVELSTA